MPVSGLVLTVPEARTRDVVARLVEHPGVTIGPAEGPRLPIVVESDAVSEDRDTFLWLQELPGVTTVELAFLDFSDVTELESRELRRMGRRPNRRRGTT